MKVSIIVIDYNYGRFVGAAIESALAQTWPDTEVIVVDDGSTDDSPAVIAPYAERVTALRKENGGQASAFNLGFAQSSGDVVFLLDADDVLYPHCVERVVGAWRAGVSKIQYRLDTIDADGRNVDLPFPHYSPDLTPAEIRRRSLAFGVYTWPVASGNAFARDFLEGALPVPDLFKNIADGYLSKLAPLYGDVEIVPEIMAAYRVHGGNIWAQAGIAGGKYATATRYELDMAQAFIARAHALGFAVDERGILLNKLHLESRLLSRRLAPQHPVAGESVGKLVSLGIHSAWVAPDLNLLGRILWSLWFPAIGFLPTGAARYLVGQFRRQDFRATLARWLIPLGRKRGALPTAPIYTAPRVSIVIANYNYGRFLAAAIDSALAQTRRPFEVIVVDDGSTDDSCAVIGRYRDDIKAISQANGGQTSAFNAGFAASVGDIVIFLDSDDRLHPDCIETVLRAWKPGIVKLQYRLDTIDAKGLNLRLPFPFYSKRLRRDWFEARRQLLAAGSYAWPVASGNAFARDYLLKVMPLPQEFRRAPDGILNRLAPLCGPVVAIDDVLADYRVHGANVLAQQALDAEKYAANVRYEIERESFISRRARTLGFDLPETILLRNKKHLETRLLSLRLSPERHPIATDVPEALARLGLKSAFRDPDLHLLGRLAWALWFVSLARLPRGLLATLVRDTRLQSGRHPFARAVVWLSRRW